MRAGGTEKFASVIATLTRYPVWLVENRARDLSRRACGRTPPGSSEILQQLIPSRPRSLTETTSASSSLWLAGRPGPEHGPLHGEIAADVVVVGGGIAGVTTALRLQREGVRVVLLEAVAIGSGVTGNTSAKVSALQGTTLSTIVSRHGTEAGAVYAAASASAVEDVAALAEEEKVDCGLDRRPAVTYAANPEELKAVAYARGLVGLVNDPPGLRGCLLLRRRVAHLEPDPAELAGEVLDVGLGESLLDRERFELGRFDPTALLARFEHRLRGFALEQLGQPVLRHLHLHPLCHLLAICFGRPQRSGCG